MPTFSLTRRTRVWVIASVAALMLTGFVAHEMHQSQSDAFAGAQARQARRHERRANRHERWAGYHASRASYNHYAAASYGYGSGSAGDYATASGSAGAVASAGYAAADYGYGSGSAGATAAGSAGGAAATTHHPATPVAPEPPAEPAAPVEPAVPIYEEPPAAATPEPATSGMSPGWDGGIPVTDGVHAPYAVYPGEPNYQYYASLYQQQSPRDAKPVWEVSSSPTPVVAAPQVPARRVAYSQPTYRRAAPMRSGGCKNCSRRMRWR